MIVVFVVDTSPSMGLSASSDSFGAKINIENSGSGAKGMSRLDLAKMAVETLTKGLDKRIQEHNRQFHHNIALHNHDSQNNYQQSMAQSLQNIGLGFAQPDHFLLLSTGQQQQQDENQYQHQQPPQAKQKSKLHIHATCGAGGRLLVGYGSSENSFGGGDSSSGGNNTGTGGVNNTSINSKNSNSNNNNNTQDHHSKQMFLYGHAQHHGIFEQELKKIKATKFLSSRSDPQPNNYPSASAVGGQQPTPPKQQLHFPENGGGARGLNIALSSGFQLLSRHRLRHRSTENFGMGRLPSSAMLSPASMHNKNAGMGAGGPDGTVSTLSNALQPACLILLTDGECLTRPKTEGGGSLQLQFGNMPLREFYSEPFRWDQRFFCVNVGGNRTSNEQTHSPIHPSLNALCEVTGGGYISIHTSSSLSQNADRLLRMIAPTRPSTMPIPDPLRLLSLPPLPPPPPTTNQALSKSPGLFVNGGPVCTFQSIERDPSGESYRAILLPALYQRPESLPSLSMSTSVPIHILPSSPPIWCIPEHYFPSKKLETLPPRTAQPLLNFTRIYQYSGLNVFDPSMVMKSLHRLDHLTMMNKQMQAIIKHKLEKQQQQQQQQHNFIPSIQLLQRDVYICHWLGVNKDGSRGGYPQPQGNLEHYPVSIRGAIRPSLTDGDDTFLNIGILNVPYSRPNDSNVPQLSTLTMLPPEPQILLPLLIRAAEAEHRVFKKALDTLTNNQKQHQLNPSLANLSRNVMLDENWRVEFRAYLFRIPQYYQHALRRCLRPILPTSAHSFLNNDSIETIASQCFSRVCLQKIRSGEQLAKESNDRLERQEDQLRRRGIPHLDFNLNKDSFLDPGYGQFNPRGSRSSYLLQLRNLPPPWKVREDVSSKGSTDNDVEHHDMAMTEVLGDLPGDCLVSYYESRRRWIFGGVSLTTKGQSVEGIITAGVNSQQYNKNHTIGDESLLSVAGVGVSLLNKTTINKMGDYRERLLWSRSPVVGYEGATTAANGSVSWSVDDDALPWQFFDPHTGEFTDSIQNRIKARLTVNFGNPYKDKRGDSLIPEIFQNQRPQLKKGSLEEHNIGANDSPAVEGEDEAVFAGKHQVSPPRTPPSSPSQKNSINDKTQEKESSKRKSSSPPSETAQKTKKQGKVPSSVSPRKEGSAIGANKASASLAQQPPPPPPQPHSHSAPGTKQKSNRSQPASSAYQNSSPNQRKPPPPPPRPTDHKQKPPPPPSSKRTGHGPPPPPPSRKPKPPPPSKITSNIPKQATRSEIHINTDNDKKESLNHPKQQKTTNKQSGQGPKRKVPLHPPPPRPPPSQKIARQAQSNSSVGTKPAQPTLKRGISMEKTGSHSVTQTAKRTISTVRPPPPNLSNPSTIKVPPFDPENLQNPKVKPKINLPAGWILVWSKSQKRWYFFDTKTNKSVWQWPPPGAG